MKIVHRFRFLVIIISTLLIINSGIAIYFLNDLIPSIVGKEKIPASGTIVYISIITTVFLTISILILFYRSTSNKINRNIQNLTDGVAQYEKGNFDNKIELPYKDELVEVADAYNKMAEQNNKNIKLLETEEDQLRQLFENSEICIWDEDFSELFNAIEEIRSSGITDFRKYLNNNRSRVQELASLVKVNHVNKSTLKTFGAELEKEMLHQIDKTFGSGAINVFIDGLCSIWNKKKLFRAETTFKTLTGIEFNAIISYQIPESKHNFNRILVSILDITELMNTKLLLRENQKRYKFIFDNMQNAFAIHKMVFDNNIPVNYIFDDVNEAFEKQTNLKKTEIIGKKVTEVLPGIKNDSFDWIKTFGEVVLTGKSISFQNYSSPLKRWYSVNAFRSEEGHFATIFQDITDTKNKENQLLTLTVAIEQSPVSIVITDPEGNIEYVNPKFHLLTGYSIDEVIGKNPRILKSGNKPEKFYRNMWNEIVSGKVWHGEFLNIKKNGEQYWEDAHIASIRDKSNKIEHFIGLKIDITDKKQLEKDKQELNLQLIQTQKMDTIGTLAGGIAHDFNNLLVPILGYSEMSLSNLNHEDPTYQYINEIIIAAHRAKDLVEQILVFSKHSEKEKKPVNLGLLIEKTLRLVKLSIPSSIEIIKGIENSQDLILGDETQISQVIINLCTNGLQAMNGSKGTLSIELKHPERDMKIQALYPDLNENEIICLSVSDTGSGMDNKIIEHIFEPFFTTRTNDKGTGLGLSVVYGIVKGHNGNILVESEPEKGTTFYIYFPVEKGLGLSEKPKERIIGKNGQDSILVVDDEDFILKMLKMMLIKYGYKVDIFNNGNNALESIKKNPVKYDLIITDLTMPSISGVDFSKKIQKIMPGIPIIILTGYSDDKLADISFKELSIKKVVKKPFSKEELISVIKETLLNE